MAIAKIGQVGTDSGALVIIDPSYLPPDLRNQVCAPTIGQAFGECLDGAAFSFATGRDGAFLVECTLNDDGEVHSITVRLR